MFSYFFSFYFYAQFFTFHNYISEFHLFFLLTINISFLLLTVIIFFLYTIIIFFFFYTISSSSFFFTITSSSSSSPSPYLLPLLHPHIIFFLFLTTSECLWTNPSVVTVQPSSPVPKSPSPIRLCGLYSFNHGFKHSIMLLNIQSCF